MDYDINIVTVGLSLNIGREDTAGGGFMCVVPPAANLPPLYLANLHTLTNIHSPLHTYMVVQQFLHKIY